MKLYIKILGVMLLLFAVVLPLLIKGADNKPIMSGEDWFPNGDRLIGLARELSLRIGHLMGGEESGPAITPGSPGAAPAEIQSSALREAPDSFRPESGKMYKWQDEQGRWHFSSDKPRQLSAATTIEDLPDVKNVMDTPVDEDADDSIMGLPGILDGKILDSVQRMTEERQK